MTVHDTAGPARRGTRFRTTALAGSLLAAVLGAPAAAQPPATQTAYVRPEAPGRLVPVADGRRLHINCKGAGDGPTVVFEAGLSQYTANTTFGTVQTAIADFARVCVYDRAGMGWSDPAPEGWTHEGMVRDLHALLPAAGVEGPYVLVAHSLGGLLVRTYARSHPGDVAGLVLVDSTTARNFEEFEAAREATLAQLDSALAVAQPGVPVIGMPPGTSAEVQMAFTPEILRGVKAEFEALARLTPEARPSSEPGALGDLPLTVIRRGRTMAPPSVADLNHRQGQEDLIALSSNATLIVAANSGHTIPLDEPQVVVQAVRDMLSAIAADNQSH